MIQTWGSEHAENTRFNTLLSKSYQKRGGRYVEAYLGGEVVLISPDEVVEKLKEIGISISRKTLYNWEKWGLIPEPLFRNSRTTDYPNETPAEAYAAWFFLNGDFKVRAKDVKTIRDKAKKIEGTQDELQLCKDGFFGNKRDDLFVDMWLTEKARILNGFRPGRFVKMDYTDFWTVGPDGKRMRKLTKP